MSQLQPPSPAQFQQMLAALEDAHHPEYEQRLSAVRAVVEQLGLADLYDTDPLQAGFLRLIEQRCHIPPTRMDLRTPSHAFRIHQGVYLASCRIQNASS